jgi:NAD(P)-dependent dehydrogenase (short-subunit alcohol dehydrogenase family)
MKIDLSGRTAIVTGSTAGIGRATAEGLARAGASVIVNGRTQARVEQAVQQMRAAFPECAIRHRCPSFDRRERERLHRASAGC